MDRIIDLDALRRELREIMESWEYAFAMGHGCSYGTDPRLRAVRQRADDIMAMIREHS